MSQTFTQMLKRVEQFHEKHDFANKENNGMTCHTALC